jgi:hypothetical protein
LQTLKIPASSSLDPKNRFDDSMIPVCGALLGGETDVVVPLFFIQTAPVSTQI